MSNLTIGNSIIKTTNTDGSNQKYIQLIPTEEETIAEFVERIAHELRDGDKLLKMTCFGSLQNEQAFELEIRNKITGEFPITWVEGENCTQSVMNGVNIWITQDKAEYLSVDQNARAVYYEDDDAEYMFVGNILSNKELSRVAGYEKLLEKINVFLVSKGFSSTDIIRTWYYLDDILDWYDDFNKVRTAFFKEKGVDKKLIPASTGVSGKNKLSSVVTMELLAVKPKAGVSVSRVESPMQCEAGNYGSSFSRAVKIESENKTFMTISGTASIEQGGKTIFPYELKKQFEYSFKVVQMIVEKEGFLMDDVSRTVAYLKDKSYLPEFNLFLEENPDYSLPYIITENTICRDDLLFEFEMDLVK